MTTFLNLDIEKKVSWKFFLIHSLYGTLWILGIYIVIFRGDYFLLKHVRNEYLWIIKTVPLLLIVVVVFVMFKSKWYYNLALIFYPILVIFWFLPKTVLQKGKIYLLSSYVSFIYNRIKRFKSAIIHTLIFAIITLLMSITNTPIVKISSILIFTYFYLRILGKYIKQSFQPAELFGANIDASLEDIIKSPEKSYTIIQSIEENKGDEKLNVEEVKQKRIERLIMVNSAIEYFGSNLNGFKGKKAFVISWIYQLVGFMVLTLTYFTFINYQLFLINSESFITTINPNVFDFFYYTIKTITFSNIESIVPQSMFAKIIEICSFFTLGVFLLIIVTSVIFSLRQDRINENIQKATQVCISQNKFIAEHIKDRYETDIDTVLKEAGNIRSSMESIKNTMEKIF